MQAILMRKRCRKLNKNYKKKERTMEENMTAQESVAYEMAMLVKENRELRSKYDDRMRAFEKLRDICFDTEEECRKLKQEIRELKHPNKKDLGYLWYEKDVPQGAKVVISDTAAKLPRYPIGFVMEVEHVSVREDGLATLYGKMLYRDEAQEGDNAQDKLIEGRINTKTYSWARVDDYTKLSTMVQKKGKKRDCYPGIGCYDKDGRYEACHYEYENLMYIPGEE